MQKFIFKLSSGIGLFYADSGFFDGKNRVFWRIGSKPFLWRILKTGEKARCRNVIEPLYLHDEKVEREGFTTGKLGNFRVFRPVRIVVFFVRFRATFVLPESLSDRRAAVTHALRAVSATPRCLRARRQPRAARGHCDAGAQPRGS